MTEREQLIEDAREFWLSTEPSSSMFEVMVDFAVKVRDEAMEIRLEYLRD